MSTCAVAPIRNTMSMDFVCTDMCTLYIVYVSHRSQLAARIDPFHTNLLLLYLLNLSSQNGHISAASVPLPNVPDSGFNCRIGGRDGDTLQQNPENDVSQNFISLLRRIDFCTYIYSNCALYFHRCSVGRIAGIGYVHVIQLQFSTFTAMNAN